MDMQMWPLFAVGRKDGLIWAVIGWGQIGDGSRLPVLAPLEPRVGVPSDREAGGRFVRDVTLHVTIEDAVTASTDRTAGR